jgi:two-component system alkaline phosphatase synthesis response regulator PhoP
MSTSPLPNLQPSPRKRIFPRPIVLLVDDNSQNLEVLEAFLADLATNVVVASDGVEALQKVEQQHPHLIVLDVMMPRMSGFEVCRRLKADPATRDIPILVLTALFESQDVESARKAGADDFVSKPISKREFFSHVDRLLRGAGW